MLLIVNQIEINKEMSSFYSLLGFFGRVVSRALGYSNLQKNIIASAGGFGHYLSGPIIGKLVDKFGSKHLVLIAALLFWTGYTFMSFTLNGYILFTSFRFVAFYYFLVGLGASCCQNACLKLNVMNFDEKSHGFAVGVSVSASGLSALIFSILSRLFYIPHRVSHDSSRLITREALSTDSSMQLDVVSFLFFLGIVTGAINLAAGCCGLHELKHHSSVKTERRNSVSSDVSSATKHESPDLLLPAEPTIIPPHSLLILTRNPTVWWLFIPFLTLSGLGLMFINNIGSIVVSLSPSGTNPAVVAAAQANMVSLISAFNFLGRITTGIVSDKLHARFGTPRIVLLVWAGIFIAVANLVGLLTTSMATLTVCACILGFGYGSVFSCTPAIVSDWFGVTHFGLNWGFFQVGPALVTISASWNY